MSTVTFVFAPLVSLLFFATQTYVLPKCFLVNTEIFIVFWTREGLMKEKVSSTMSPSTECQTRDGSGEPGMKGGDMTEMYKMVWSSFFFNPADPGGIT